MNGAWKIQNEAVKDAVKDFIEYVGYNDLGRSLKEHSYMMFFAMDILEELSRNREKSPLDLLEDYHEKMFTFSMANPNTEEMFSVGLMVIDSIMEQFM